MANQTITGDAETLKSARLRAIERGESVNRYLAERLREYAFANDEEAQRVAAATQFVELSRQLTGSSDGQLWTRYDLYDERSDHNV